MEFTKDELIEAIDATKLTSTSNGRDQILAGLKEAADMGPQFWVTVKVMAKHVSIGDMRVRNILSALVNENIIEVGKQGQSNAYRLKPKAN